MARCPHVVAILILAALSASARSADDILLADFEGKDYGVWKVEGDAFGHGPAAGTLGHQQAVSGYLGKGLVNTYYKGDGATGTLISPPFKIERSYINFLIGGGGHVGKTCVELLVEGKAVLSATGENNERLTWSGWDVRKLAGKQAAIRIVDRATGGWGHINVDHIVQSDSRRGELLPAEPLSTAGEQAQAVKIVREAGVDEIVYAVRAVDGDGHWYANFSYWSNNPQRTLYHDGGKLCRLDLTTGKVTTLIDEPTGGVRDPQMHYDGKKILFSYRKGGQPYYHLYEINIDGSGLRQITDGPYDDLEPCYLPDGGIVFCSSRCNRWVNCYYVRVAVLYRCEADGSEITMLSSNIEQDNTPWVLSDGRILHQRWEYIDRSQVRYHHLWTMNPDGTGQMVYYGNMHPSIVMIDAKPIPGTQKVVVSFSPGHGQKEHAGAITVIDPRGGPDEKPFAQTIHKSPIYRDPYPLREDLFLVAGQGDIRVMDAQGRTRVLHELEAADRQRGLWMHEPRPLRGRPRERIIPRKANAGEANGTVILADVHVGRNMEGVKRGEIKKLLVLEALPKPINFTGGWEPITFGGSFTLERVVGTVPVEPDGSAHFELPSLRSLFFVALDANDRAVKRMQSFLTVQPGEVFSCVGCHEHRTRTIQPVGYLQATSRPPSKIEPIPDVPDVLDFPRDIQPILNRHCAACHDYDKTDKGGPRSGGVILAGDRGAMYSHSYYMLTLARQFSDGRNADGNNPPRSIGSSNSPLLDKLAGKHHGVKATEHEQKVVRLWIESAAAYPGTYAALGTGMIGATFSGDKRFDRKGWDRAGKVIQEQCGKCHAGNKALPTSPDQYKFGFGGGHVDGRDVRYRFDSNIVFNLSRPEKSLALLVPLAKEAGGYASGRDKEKKTGHEAVFRSKGEPDYVALLEAITLAKQYLDEIKRFDMPGFRPNRHYLREMKLYGILPADLGEDAPVDCYRVDQAYWRSFWHKGVLK
ncbi:MAG: translocation protein TolB [Planctomycetes bacterium ADurb.Bin126]|nr:MAG: translocation protein TolB [Planctomycetes bacterium ADurb.Bin126]HOD83662.1 hypothetical protein [Phycisphaerae bacterium]HQL73534.1 hypothetical protein [Phycisphaerae bacterium]